MKPDKLSSGHFAHLHRLLGSIHSILVVVGGAASAATTANNKNATPRIATNPSRNRSPRGAHTYCIFICDDELIFGLDRLGLISPSMIHWPHSFLYQLSILSVVIYWNGQLVGEKNHRRIGADSPASAKRENPKSLYVCLYIKISKYTREKRKEKREKKEPGLYRTCFSPWKHDDDDSDSGTGVGAVRDRANRDVLPGEERRVQKNQTTFRVGLRLSSFSCSPFFLLLLLFLVWSDFIFCWAILQPVLRPISRAGPSVCVYACVCVYLCLIWPTAIPLLICRSYHFNIWFEKCCSIV